MSPDPSVTAPPARRFEGRTAIVTGAGSGIGRATAIRLAAEGASVACLDVVADNLDETVEALAVLGGKALAYRCDVTDEAVVNDTVAQVASALGRPEVLCNVAGIGTFAHTADLPLATWDRILAVNLTGTFLMTRAVLPHMISPLNGSVVNVASTSGLMGAAYSAAYCASKGGVVLFTKALAHEYAGRGVRINAVAPGGVDTPLIGSFSLPEGADPKHINRITSRMGFCTPDQVAAAIAFLASEESAYTTGAVLSVDGGITA
ncbi:MAG: glucose 1-dehydrogenase [Acidimicrobiales bacterium]|jgi:NAD(P)-dependent dehydrogenase (short-subunit alcohol dehydrogenase family)